jgi:5-hydroxyisourate hydrolase-like protein (transthyretin family)
MAITSTCKRSRWSKIGGIALFLVSVVVLLSACGGGSTAQSANKSSSFHTTIKTTDGMFQVQFSVTPDQLGTNTFSANITDTSTGKPASDVSVNLSTTMLTMDMGTDIVTLQSNGQGKYCAQGELSMDGQWEIHILLHTPDHALHEAIVQFTTS